MPKRKICSTASKLKQGRGQGHGKGYQPFLKVREVPSKGLSHRTKGWHTQRIQHLLSTLENNYLLVLDWSQLVVDVREQFPLPLDETLRIAERLSIKHPWVNEQPVVITTDFLIDIRPGDRIYRFARTLKYVKELSNDRVIEKLEIERTYWAEQGVDWGIVTELDIPEDLVHNLRWLRQGIHLEDLPGIDHVDVSYYENALHSILSSNPAWSLAQVGKEVDSRLCLEAGNGLSLIRYFIATRIWQVNMMTKIIPSQPLVLLDRTSMWKENVSNE
jgi:hypothetical protein